MRQTCVLPVVSQVRTVGSILRHLKQLVLGFKGYRSVTESAHGVLSFPSPLGGNSLLPNLPRNKSYQRVLDISDPDGFHQETARNLANVGLLHPYYRGPP